MLNVFFNQQASLKSVAYPQDAGGGELVTPATSAQLVPCNLQQDDRPEVLEGDPNGRGQQRRGSKSRTRLFFAPSDVAGLHAMLALKVNDVIDVQSFFPINRTQRVHLDGPAFDRSGQGVVWEVACRDIR